MELFISTLEQMVFLFAFIIIGYVVTKLGAVPKSAAGILSKLENNIFIPALVMGTFIKNFKVSTKKFNKRNNNDIRKKDRPR